MADEAPNLKLPVYMSIALIILSGIFLGICLLIANNRFRSLDVMPELLSLTPDAKSEFGGNPSEALVGLYIRDFSEFDMMKNSFQFSGILWFLYDPSLISLDTLAKFSFEKGEVLFLSKPSTRIVGGKLLARYDIRVRMRTDLVFKLFPFDSHMLYITLDNNYVSPGEIILFSTPNEFVLSPGISITGWQIHNSAVYTGYSTSLLEKTDLENKVSHPRIIFALGYNHAGMRNALTIVLPLILILFMALFSFIMLPSGGAPTASIIALSSGAVSALIGYRFVIENLSPKVGYFLLSDKIFFLFLAVSILIFFINIAFIEARQKHLRKIILAIHLIIDIGFFYLISF